MNISQQQLEDIGRYIQDYQQRLNQTLSDKPECQNVDDALLSNWDSFQSGDLESYSDLGIENFIEIESGKDVLVMFRIPYEEEVFIMALTSDNYACFSTESVFCSCLDLSEYA